MAQQLPKIQDRLNQSIVNPFYVPDEYEIFKMKEKEKQIKMEERIKFQNLRVHEKGIKQKEKLSIREINEIGKEEDKNDKEYNAKINIIDAADNAVKNRVRQKEPMYQFIDKKREMLLFQMLIDHKRGMIDEFEKLTKLHRLGLEKSEQLIEEDVELFNKFLEQNKMSSREAIKEAERETKLKQEKNNEIKALQEHRTDLMTKIQQKIDNLEDLLKYKKFLDKITPKEFQMKQKQPKQQQQQQQQVVLSRNNQNNQINNELQQLLNDSDDEQVTYFTQPKQLEEIFQQLEEKNLFLIGNTKEREQMVEDLRNKYYQKIKTLEEKQKTAQQTKNEFLRQIDQVNEQIKGLKAIRSDSEVFEPLKNLENQIAKIYRSDVNIEPRKDITGIEMLKETEKLLEQRINDLKMFRQIAPDLVLEKEKNCIKARKDIVKQMKQEQDLLDQQKKQKEQQKEQIVHKRIGRPIMTRSWPPQVQVEEQVVDDITEEEKERIKYFT
ncbi:unnamed protein product [Paramecium sonneborni]|uniref:DUF4200 domain-containing protein n=1 Tax=Paramecium sonneborni TaxID=65129 RepID=A0A8S1L930_9CILI|nr:unnamed protein product [Paramecium sonneborni]